MALAELDLSRYDLPAKPRLAVVGTPCEIQGIRAMQARRWPTGAHRVDAVVLTIALLCTKSFDYEALMLRELRDKRGLDLDRVSKVDVIHGRMIVEYRDGSVAVDEPVKDFHGAALEGLRRVRRLPRSWRRPVDRQRRLDGGMVERARAHRGRVAWPSSGPGVGSTCATSTIPRPSSGSTTWTSASPSGPCNASSTPTRPLFIDFAEHLEQLPRHRPGPVWDR